MYCTAEPNARGATRTHVRHRRVQHDMRSIMLTFITDVLPGEIDILSVVRHETLTIRSLDDDHIASFDAPPAGWTHARLCELARQTADQTTDGADAYLGGTWVGGTEV